jgi:hypothetical protein
MLKKWSGVKNTIKKVRAGDSISTEELKQLVKYLETMEYLVWEATDICGVAFFQWIVQEKSYYKDRLKSRMERE